MSSCSSRGGSDLGLQELVNSSLLVREAAHPEANIIFGNVIDDSLGDEIRVTVIAAGFDDTLGAQTVDDAARVDTPPRTGRTHQEARPLGTVPQAVPPKAAHRAVPEVPTRTGA